MEKNHDRSAGIWMVYYKKSSGKPRISYEAAVEEAICFGWIDSIVKKIDEEKFCQKFTPRKKNSRWSELNKKRAEKLIGSGLMTEPGLKKIREAKKNGEWSRMQANKVDFQIPVELEKALKDQMNARNNFKQLSPSTKRQMIGWICAAKKPVTRIKRIEEVIELLKNNRKLGMK